MLKDAFRDVVYQPFWWEQRPRTQPEQLPVPAEADIAVVGSGYTGLSAALTALRGGKSVVIFEAQEAGHGEIGRAHV